MLSVKVSSKHQISVPSEARRRLAIAAGDRLTIEIRGDEMILRRRPGKASERLRGLGSHVWDGIDPVAYVRELRDEAEVRLRERETRLADGLAQPARQRRSR